MVRSAIANVKLSRRSASGRKIYDISHLPLNTKHRNTFRRRDVRMLESTVTRSSSRSEESTQQRARGRVFSYPDTFQRAHRSEDGSHYSRMIYAIRMRSSSPSSSGVISRDFVANVGNKIARHSCATSSLFPSRIFIRSARGVTRRFLVSLFSPVES